MLQEPVMTLEVGKDGTPKSLNKAVWELLGPRIEQAEASNDLTALRALEDDLHKTLASLLQYGLYQVQWAEVRVARETDQQRTLLESERDDNEKDIRFARSLPKEDVYDLENRVWEELHAWFTRHNASEDIRHLVQDYAVLLHGGAALGQDAELEDTYAYMLADAYRDALLRLQSRQFKKGRPF